MGFIRAFVALALLLAIMATGTAAAQNCHMRQGAALAKPSVVAAQPAAIQATELAKAAESQQLSDAAGALQGNCCTKVMAACCAVGVLPGAAFAPRRLSFATLTYPQLTQRLQPFVPGTDLRPPILA